MAEQAIPLSFFMEISLSDDKLNAFLQFKNYEDSLTFNMEQLEEVLKSYQIIHGINRSKLNDIIRNPKEIFLTKTLIATGTPPKNGQDGYISYQFDLGNDSKKPTELEDGKVDFKEVTTIHNVRKGQLIAQRILATKGIPGRAVTGEALPAKDGKEARLKPGKNVVMDAEQIAMYSAIDGMITQTEREKINVFPIFEVNGDVDYNIGNIDFVGSVVIRGSVLTGFKIKAAGDIRITGSVEGADLDADGSIEISAGILGHNKGTIRAGKRIKSSFIQDATIIAHEVLVSQSIMHSTIRASKEVICKGTKGLIVGGTIQAGELVAARTIGNSMSTATVIEVGVLPDLRNELVQLRTQLRNVNENVDKTDKALVLLDQLAATGQMGPDKVAMRIKLNHTKRQLTEEQSTIKDRVFEIEKSLEDSDQAKVEVVSTIYSGAKVVIGRYTKFIKDPITRVRFRLADGDIAMMPL
ncbi:DUF342 domain-containing protein [Paenibacillus radicis (ex Xue et al. 2023)]|uniref:FapA family protein n=1 Tax=Paenibacillus radicis (ex Xue et al. 2023) TaxID=2972489 RepID=A0ABT1YCA1_9BACL|nr:FapA family protein [Paenibacillus radicis (ex Xue et al. 2023)]MCR8630786.1 FapA family protein [Paenibacillus radicis (ex Xue et al. 2023)]